MVTGETEGRPIVRTDSVLGGKPRIEGTRIGVHHVAPLILEKGNTVEHVVTVTYPDLSEGDVLSALAYYIEHREDVEAIRRENDRVRENEITGPDDLPPELRSE
jgi:uncharacterized protein (DUF433 family)